MPEWNIAKHDTKQVAKITDEFGINEICAKLLINRGYTADDGGEKEKTRAFLEKSTNLLCDPFMMSDMERGIDRLKRAYVNGEKVMIYGDYDVDGISSTCIMYMYLDSLGFDICYYIPDRFEEGYGINKSAVDKAKEKAIDLIITVDTGITATEETKYANGLGIDIVITDHHECPKILPEAAAVINPKKPDCMYPFKELAGVGVAFKFISAYNIKYGKTSFDFDGYCEFAAMGTVADIMTLTGENRVMVDIGLKKMQNSKNYGINAILESYFKTKNKKSVSTDIIGFYISPRINAAGRLAKADRAVELFLSKNKPDADIIAEELSVLNRRRQETEKEIFIQAENELSGIEGRDGKKIIILYGDDWNQGVIGIVASKLSEKYNKAFILFAKDAGGICKGSGRSVRNINITELLAACADILIKYGGHERAAGLSAEYKNLGELDRRLNKYADDNNITIESGDVCNIECEINADNITCDTVRELEIMEPFGNDNPVPIFAVAGCKITNITQIGDNKHLRIEFSRGKYSFEAVYFNMEADNFAFDKYNTVDIACNIQINEFMNREKIQYIIRDMRIGGCYASNYLAEKENYTKFMTDGIYAKVNKTDVPEREDFKSVYIFLVNSFKKGAAHNNIYNINKVHNDYFEYSNKRLSRFKFRVILDIFCETEIIYIEHDFDNINKIKINEHPKKIDLDNSEIYKRLKNKL